MRKIAALLGSLLWLLACDDSTGNDTSCANNSCANNLHNINTSTTTCSGIQDDKMGQIHWLSTRIYNGTSSPKLCVPPSQQRATVALLDATSPGDAPNYCSGTLVSPTRVLTAAHCVSDVFGSLKSPEEIQVGFGEDLDNPDALFDVVSVECNPDYSYFGEETGLDHAVLTLGESPLESLDVEPIPVHFIDTPSLQGRYVQQVGYGTTQETQNNRRRWWTVELVAGTDSSLGELIVDGQSQSSVCGGDSGGPSLYPIGGSGLSIVGTVSWGDESCVDLDHYAMPFYDMAFLSPLLPEYNYCGELGSEGVCEENMARWCEEGIVHTQCCDEKSGPCTVVDGRARCQNPREVCPDTLDFRGTCHNNVVRWCFNGLVHERDCTACGQVCQNTRNSTIGYYCVTP